MTPQPIYTVENLHGPAYQLRFSWSCWPSRTHFPDPPGGDILKALAASWEGDGIRKLECRWSPELIQYTVSVKPHVAPVFLAARLKGRLQHALREAGTPVDFSRKLSVRSLGDATSADVERYIRNQVGAARYVDPRTRRSLARVAIDNPDVDLSKPTVTNSGRYWYNLHLVLVAEERMACFDSGWLARIRQGCLRIADKKGCRIADKKGCGISVGSVMPDHLHLALRGNIDHSAQDIALAFLNNLAYLLGSKAVWQFGFYAGTFGEYDMRCVRE